MSGQTADKLVYMANQISDFFRTQGRGDESEPARVLGVADHIRAFWDPRMRRLLFDHVDQHDGEGLKPLALEAVALLMAQPGLTPQALHAASVAAGASVSSAAGPGDDAG